MQEEKFGKLIKEIRNKYHLTQKDLADKYHVTYQAVSKWENGKTIPDITILREIANDFNISMEDIIDGNLVEKKRKKLIPIGIVSLVVIAIIIAFIFIFKNDDFKSKTLSSTCKDYKISGIISYNSTKSVIYIPKLEYCGEENTTLYHDIKCTLYEINGDIIKRIDNYEYHDGKLTLNDFMKLVNFNVDNYLQICKNPSNDSFYLEIEAIDSNDDTYLHKIPLTIDEECNG